MPDPREFAAAAAELASSNGAAPADVCFEVLTARELLAIPEPPESDLLLGPLVVRGARTIIVADTGHGKTTLAMQLVAAVLTGGEALGYQGAAAGPVLIVDLEQGLRSIKRTLREAGLADRDDVLYVRAPDGLALDCDGGHRVELERVIAASDPAVLVLDPYYKAHRGDANEERAIVDLMRYLDALRTRHGFALILPAHPRKAQDSNGARKLTLHDVAGSGAVVRGAELVVAIERLSHGYARLRILKDRDGDLPVGDAWPLLFTRGEGFRLDPKEETTAEELEQRIVELGADGTWRIVDEYATELGVRRTRVKTTLEQLADAGPVEQLVGAPGRSSRAHCYRTRPGVWDRSGRVSGSLLDDATCPTRPPVRGTVDGTGGGGARPGSGRVRDDEELERLATLAREAQAAHAAAPEGEA